MKAKKKLGLAGLVALLKEFGITYVVLEPEDVLSITCTTENEEPAWSLDVCLGIMFGRNVMLFDYLERPLGMAYPELFDGMERYVFDPCSFINQGRKKK